MAVTDRYLHDRERIVNRLGAHIDLARKGGALQSVSVHTTQGHNEQKAAVQELKGRYPELRIKFKTAGFVPHDRVIDVTYDDGARSRVLIGMGLGFIRDDGQVNDTFLVFQNDVF